MTSFTITRKIALPIDKIWDLAVNFSKSPGPGVVVRLEKQGDARSGGVGTERTITIGSVCVRERLESLDPANKRFAYKILSGAPMKDHFAKAEFIPRGLATEIHWDVEFKSKIPGIGWILANVTKKAINRYLDVVENAAR